MMGMSEWGQLLYSLLDILVKAVIPVMAGVTINFLLKKIGREKFQLAREIVASIVNGVEQQYRSGQIAKDDRYILALRQGIEQTGLTEEKVGGLIQEAVMRFNLQIGKYS